MAGMLLRLPRLMLVRMFAALLLVTVGLQAGAPMGQPLERSHGSAFSAATHEVALAAPRRAEPAREAAAPLRLAQVVYAAACRPVAAPALPAPRPHSTGPPSFPPLSFPPAPRAPPTA